jgi:hypothetical protein
MHFIGCNGEGHAVVSDPNCDLFFLLTISSFWKSQYALDEEFLLLSAKEREGM